MNRLTLRSLSTRCGSGQFDDELCRLIAAPVSAINASAINPLGR